MIVVYRTVISPIYEYAGFLNNENDSFAFYGWIIYIVGLIMCKPIFTNKKRMSLEIIYILFLISFTPYTVLVQFGLFSREYIIANAIYWFLLIACLVVPINVRNSNSIFTQLPSCINNKNAVLKVVFIAVSVVIVFVAGRYGGFRISLDIIEVYGRRQLAQEAGLPRTLTYLFNWSKAILPICIGLFIKSGQKIWAIFGVLVGVMSFGFDGSKTAFGLVVIAVIVNLMPDIKLRLLNLYALLAGNFAMILILLDYRFRNGFTLASYIVRRSMLVPELLRSNYFDFFTTHTPDYYKASFLRYFGFKSVYKDIPQMISSIYYPNLPVSNANNGLISDAVTNMGLMGVVIMPVILAIVLRLLDNWTSKIYMTVYLSFAVGIAFYFSNSFLFTILLTHGLLVVMIVLRRTNRYRWDVSEKRCS